MGVAWAAFFLIACNSDVSPVAGPPPSVASTVGSAPTGPSSTPPPSSSTSSTTTPTAKARAPTGLVDVQEVEPSIRVALNKLTSDNFTGAPLPGYEANRAFLTPQGAQALANVQRRLAPQGLGLKVYDAYRPARATRAMVEWARDQGRADLVGPYIASVSYHNSGQAVDLTLVQLSTGEELDMGTPYETYAPAAHTANATGEAARNRAVLVEAMHAEGFVNYEGEWWHFYYFVTGAPLLDEPVR